MMLLSRLALTWLCVAGVCLAQFANPFFGRGVWRGNVVDFRIVDGWAIVEGDIVAGRAVDLAARYQALLAAETEEAKHRIRQSLVVADQARLWPDGIIPYEIDPAIKDTRQIEAAIQHWNQRTSLKVVPRNGEANYFKVTPNEDPTVCSSSAIGMAGGMQLVRASESCSAYILIHEIGHVVGLLHEQARNDRDRHIRLLWENVQKFGLSQFGASIASANAGPYDHNSIMHYPGAAFTKNGLSTIETKPPGIPMGDALELSAGDIDAVNRLYGRIPQEVTISSTPPGLELIVDGERITTPRAFTWGRDSTHTVEAPGAQADSKGRYEFARWSDNGERAHTLTVNPDTATLYTASFVRYNRFQLRVVPEAAGTIRIMPESPDGHYREGTRIGFLATPNPGFVFAYWSGPFIEHNVNLTNLPVNPLNTPAYADFQDLTANFIPVPSTTPTPTNRPLTRFVSSLDSGESTTAQIRIDGRLYQTPVSFAWEPGSSHDVEVPEAFPVAGDFSLRRFLSWSDGQERKRQVVGGEEAAVYTARFGILYTVLGRWVGRGTLDFSPSPPDGFFERNSAVELKATPEAGNQFVGWAHDLGGNDPLRTLQMRESMDVLGFFGAQSAVSNFAVTNAARKRPNSELTGTSIFAKLSPGEIVTIHMSGAGPDMPISATPSETGSISARLGDIRVLLEGVAIPVLSAEKGKVTAFVPYAASVLVGGGVRVQIEQAGALSGPGVLLMSPANPAIYTADGSGSGQAKLVNEDGAANGPDSPSRKGSVVTLFATGLGVPAQPASNTSFPSILGPGPRGELEVRIGGAVAEVVSAGLATNELGVYRIEARVPESARSGPATPLILTVDGAPSQYNVTIAVQ